MTTALTYREPSEIEYAAARAAAKRRLSPYRDITDDDVDRLVHQFDCVADTPAGAVLSRPEEDQKRVHLLVSGWLIAWVCTGDDRRYIHRVHRAGDLVGVEDMNWTYATTNVTAIKDCRVFGMDKARFVTLLTEDRELSPYLFGIAMLEQVIMVDRAQANARLPARWRLAHFLLTMEAEQQRYGDSPGPYFHVPLTQREIADCIGVSAIHANRALKTLTDEGYIERSGHDYRILRRDDLREHTGWIDRLRVANYLAA